MLREDEKDKNREKYKGKKRKRNFHCRQTKTARYRVTLLLKYFLQIFC